MSKSSRRVMQTTVAVVGMAAIGAVGSGTAFAQTAADVAPEGAGQTDLTGVEDGLGSAEEVGGVDLHNFQLPSLGEQSVKNSHHVAKKKNKDSDDDKDSDDKGKKDKKDSDDDSDKKDGKKDRSDSKKKSDKDDDDKDDDKGGKHRKKN